HYRSGFACRCMPGRHSRNASLLRLQVGGRNGIRRLHRGRVAQAHRDFTAMADMIFSDRSALQPSPGSGDGWRIGPQTGKAVDSALQAVSLANLVWLLAACGGADTAPDDGVPTYDQFEAPAELARLAWTPVVGYDGAADDFLLRGDTLVLLDTRVSEISVLVRSPAAPGKGARGEIWRRSGSFGRRGNGPGEFRQPRGLAWAPDGSFWTWDESNRLNRFTTGGELREELRPAFPCPLFRSSVAAAGGELFVAGNCADGAAASDTVYARAFIVASDATAREVASAPVLTGDFRFGSIMTAPRLIVEGRDDVLFATGLDACLTRLGSSPAAADTNARRCFTPPARYRSPAPELLEEFRFP